jgi:hypothetical protein
VPIGPVITGSAGRRPRSRDPDRPPLGQGSRALELRAALEGQLTTVHQRFVLHEAARMVDVADLLADALAEDSTSTRLVVALTGTAKAVSALLDRLPLPAGPDGEPAQTRGMTRAELDALLSDLDNLRAPGGQQ